MPGIEIKGRSKIANYRHGGRTRKFGGGRTNLLEQLGRVEAEPSNPNRRAEISRVHGELNRGYKTGGRAGFKRAGAVTKADLAKRDLWRKRELKRRSQIGQRKSKWDIKGGISGHPLNPFRIHAAGKATDWTKKYKDTYGRTRDELKKSRDTKVKQVAENFQKMDYKDKAKGTYEEKDYAPKLTKRIHVGRKTGGRIGKLAGGWMLKKPVQKLLEGIGGGSEGKPHSTRAGRISAGVRKIKRGVKEAKREDKAEGGRIGFKKGTDKKWIQKAVDPKHKGYCTPMTKKTCTPARKALARTFKKKAKTGWG
jgi:hypothetical protein